MLMKYRALLFDWSGTLVDDLPPTLHATNEILAEYGVAPMDREEFRLRFRLPYPDFYEEVLPGVPIAELEGTFRSSFKASPDPVTILEHSREMLEWCRSQNIRCFVLSSMDETLLLEQAHRFDLHQYFEGIYAAIIDKRERIGDILAENELVKSETAFVGDMLHDIATAKHGGVASVAVETGYDPAERLAKAEPTHLFSNLSEFRDWLESK